MNEFSRQDMQVALQQNTNIILTKLASRQDVLEAVQCLSQKICSKQDLQNILDKNRDKLLETMVRLAQMQQNAIEQLSHQVDLVDKKLNSLNHKLDEPTAISRVLDNGVNREEHNTIFSTMPISTMASGRT